MNIRNWICFSVGINNSRTHTMIKKIYSITEPEGGRFLHVVMPNEMILKHANCKQKHHTLVINMRDLIHM